MSLALSAAPRRSRNETGRAFRNPTDELGEPRVAAQGLDTGILSRQFRLGQRGMNFIVTDLLKQDGRPALSPFKLGDQVMMALTRIGRNRAVAKRTDRIVLGVHSQRDSAEVLSARDASSRGSAW